MAFFLFLVNHSKLNPYCLFGLLEMRKKATTLVQLPEAPRGVWMGVRLARRISQVLFYRFLYAGMLLTGVKLLWDGLA
jgi:uncharacterized protein